MQNSVFLGLGPYEVFHSKQVWFSLNMCSARQREVKFYGLQHHLIFTMHHTCIMCSDVARWELFGECSCAAGACAPVLTYVSCAWLVVEIEPTCMQTSAHVQNMGSYVE